VTGGVEGLDSAGVTAQPASVSLTAISHHFGAARVVDDVTLDIAPAEFVALLGPSGCGKTTLLRIAAGLQRQSAGAVLIDGRPVDGLTPRQRGVGIVFQSYALFPHMTVLDNVCYGLDARGMPRREARAKAAEMMAALRIGEFAGRMPRALSGGQQQRVALARTLAVGPRILLLDEPLAALDKNLRLDMQIEIRRLQRQFAITTIMVTHDQEEAMSMADRVAVMNAGRLEQFAAPAEVYDRPQTPFVAGFVGTTNLLEARLERRGNGATLHLAGGTLAIEDPGDVPTGPVRAAIRPEQWEISPDGTLPATVSLAMTLGAAVLVDLVLHGGTAAKLTLQRTHAPPPRPGQTVALRARPAASIRLFA